MKAIAAPPLSALIGLLLTSALVWGGSSWLLEHPVDEPRPLADAPDTYLDLSTVVLLDPVASDVALELSVEAEPGTALELSVRLPSGDHLRPAYARTAGAVTAILSFEPSLPSLLRVGAVTVATGPPLPELAGRPAAVELATLGASARLSVDGDVVAEAQRIPSGAGSAVLRAMYGAADLRDIRLVDPADGRAALGVSLAGIARAGFAASLATWVLAALLPLAHLVPGADRAAARRVARRFLRPATVGVAVLAALPWAMRLEPQGLGPLAPIVPFGVGLIVVAYAWPAISLARRRMERTTGHVHRRLARWTIGLLLGLLTLELYGQVAGLSRRWSFTWASDVGAAPHLWYFDPRLIPFGDNLVADQAFRGRRPSVRPEPGQLRIVVFGGSQVWGSQLPPDSEDALFTAELDRLLGPEVEVLNAGFQAGTSWNHRMLLAGRIARLHPDIVIVDGGLNDRAFDWGDAGAQARALARTGPVWWLVDRSALAAVGRTVGDALERWGLVWPRLAGWGREERLRNLDDNIRAMARVAEDIGAELVLIGEPDVQVIRAMRAGEEVPPDRLEGLAEELGRPYLDLTRRLADTGSDTILLDRTHFSLEGHRVVAEILADQLRESGLLDELEGASSAPTSTDQSESAPSARSPRTTGTSAS